MSGEERKQIPAAATAERIEWPESVGRAFFFFFFSSCLPAEDICVFTISWRKPEARCSPCARVRRSERRGELACEPVRLLHVEQMKCFEEKRTNFTGPERELIDVSFVTLVQNLVYCLSGFNFVIGGILELFQTLDAGLLPYSPIA